MKDSIFLILILVLALVPPIYSKMTESFKNKKEGFTLGGASGDYPSAQNNVLVQDTYPITGINGVSDESANKMWWRYPTFEVGSYKQMTNNIRYPDNPDEGTCMPASMCGALYHEKKTGDNYVKVLPQINPNCGTRVGYFSTNKNLLPFKSNFQNILY